MTSKEIAKNEVIDEYYVVPVVDILENSDVYELQFEMPGVTRENIDITLENNELEVKGRVNVAENEDKELKYSEYTLQNYYRKFNIDRYVDRNKIDAGLENGILTLKLYKSEDVKPRKIEVTVN